MELEANCDYTMYEEIDIEVIPMGKIYGPVKKEAVSARDYLSLRENESKNIKNARFVPPRIGDGSFGHFEIEYKFPKLRPVHG